MNVPKKGLSGSTLLTPKLVYARFVSRHHGNIGGPSTEVCGASLSGKYPTNLKQHLRKFHYVEFWEVLAKETELKERKKKESKIPFTKYYGKQLTVTETLEGKKAVYDKNSER